MDRLQRELKVSCFVLPFCVAFLFLPADISYKLSSALALTPGDAINSTPREHIMLFLAWTSADHSSAAFLEEPGCSSSKPYARRTDTKVKINADGTITLASNGMTFVPIRFFSNSKVC
jgi:hypothetical protein